MTATRHVSAPAPPRLQRYAVRVSRVGVDDVLVTVATYSITANEPMVSQLARQALVDAERRFGGAVLVEVVGPQGEPVLAVSGR